MNWIKNSIIIIFISCLGGVLLIEGMLQLMIIIRKVMSWIDGFKSIIIVCLSVNLINKKIFDN